jgi:endonuclease G
MLLKRLLLGLLLFVSFTVNAQTVVLKHKTYTSTYDTQKNYPVLVEYWLTKTMLVCDTRIPRGTAFKPDPLAPKETDLQSSYDKSGYDRGHNMNAEDNRCDKIGMDESFYFSNMTPQVPQLNRGVWKSLETEVREAAAVADSVKVWMGSVGEVKKVGKLSIPAKCWKVIYIKKSGQYFAWIFPNEVPKDKAVKTYEVKVIDVEKLSGLKFGKPE